MRLLSDLYNVTLKKGIRGKAKEGFVRPTIGEFFMSDRDFEEILNNIRSLSLNILEGSYINKTNFGNITTKNLSLNILEGSYINKTNFNI